MEDRLAQRSGVRTFRPGRASGPLLGGNLTVLSSLVGTPFVPDFEGAILFIEDTDEAQYRIDRMLTQLSLAGILGRVAGVVFGQCTDCVARNSSSIGGFTLSEVLEQHLAPLGIPAFQGALFGHVADVWVTWRDRNLVEVLKLQQASASDEPRRTCKESLND